MATSSKPSDFESRSRARASAGLPTPIGLRRKYPAAYEPHVSASVRSAMVWCGVVMRLCTDHRPNAIRGDHDNGLIGIGIMAFIVLDTRRCWEPSRVAKGQPAAWPAHAVISIIINHDDQQVASMALTIASALTPLSHMLANDRANLLA